MESLLCKSIISLILMPAGVDSVGVIVWLLRRIISLPLLWPFVNAYDRFSEFDRLRFGDRDEHMLSRRSTGVRFELEFDTGIEFHRLAPRFSVASSINGRYSNFVLLLLWYVWSCFGECEWQLWRWWWCTCLKQHNPSPCNINAILVYFSLINKIENISNMSIQSNKIIICSFRWKHFTYMTFITIPTAETIIIVSASISKSWYINRLTAK